MLDNQGRNIEYIRISVTDRCNLRCKYCMPKDIEMVPMEDILSYEEIIRVAKSCCALGINNFRLTGGEPLVRKGSVELVKKLKSIPGCKSVSMTTNGVLLSRYAKDLKESGLDSVNVSLDTIDREIFKSLTNKDNLNEVLWGIDAALANDLKVKINAVSREDLDWRMLLQKTDDLGVRIRFIEMMPIGFGTKFPGKSNVDLLKEMESTFGPSYINDRKFGNGPAVYYSFRNHRSPVGFISAMHGKFCNMCNRVRLTSEGKLKLCLSYTDGTDLRAVLRDENSTDEKLTETIKEAILRKPAEHSFEKLSDVTEHSPMISIGG